VGPSRATVITYVNPIVALALGVAVLGESVTAGTIAGLLLILAGSWLAAEGRLPGRKAPAAPPDEPCPPPEVAPAGELARAQASVAIRRSSGAAR
jgi:EamA-like transporter family